MNEIHNIDWHRAVKWWPQAFAYDYLKYVEAMFPWDIEKQENHLMSKKEGTEYRLQQEYKMINNKEDWEIFKVINIINVQVIEVLKMINIVIK